MFKYLILVLLPISNILTLTLETIYDDHNLNEITDKIIIELISNPYFQRLKKINQYGPREYVIKRESYTRYDHSIGVMLLLKNFGASLEEQIAGLLHDVSHTVFSHVGDSLFGRLDNINSYQDEIHYDFIKSTSLKEILEKYNLDLETIANGKEKFLCLEQDIPEICADRLEYNLQGAFIHGCLNKTEISEIINNLEYKNDKFYFKEVNIAKKFAEIPLKLMIEVWSSIDNMIIYDLT